MKFKGWDVVDDSCKKESSRYSEVGGLRHKKYHKEMDSRLHGIFVEDRSRTFCSLQSRVTKRRTGSGETDSWLRSSDDDSPKKTWWTLFGLLGE